MDKNKHKETLPNYLLEEFGQNLQPEMNLIWGKSGLAEDTDTYISPEEIDHALSLVHGRINEDELMPDKPGTGTEITGWINTYVRFAVAAVALIVAGTLFFLVPITATVPYGEIAIIELRDGSTIEANSGTTLRYSRLYPFLNRHIEFNGEAYFNVEAHKNPFIVNTNGATVEVTGTQFNIRSWRDEPDAQVSVTVTGGEVRLFPAHNQVDPVIITPGNESRWSPQLSEPTRPEPVAIDDVLAWREQRFVFREQPLISILMELERRYNVTIEMAAPEAEQSALTAYYSQPTSVESVLDDICTVKGLRYTQTTTGFRIFN